MHPQNQQFIISTSILVIGITIAWFSFGSNPNDWRDDIAGLSWFFGTCIVFVVYSQYARRKK